MMSVLPPSIPQVPDPSPSVSPAAQDPSSTGPSHETLKLLEIIKAATRDATPEQSLAVSNLLSSPSLQFSYVTSQGGTLLTSACRHSNDTVAMSILNHSRFGDGELDVWLRDDRGTTALVYASVEGMLEVVESILSSCKDGGGGWGDMG